MGQGRAQVSLRIGWFRPCGGVRIRPPGRRSLPALDAIVDRAGRKLGVSLGDGDVWSRLDRLTTRLLDRAEPVRIDDLPPEVRSKLERTVWAKVLGTSAAGSAAAARVAS